MKQSKLVFSLMLLFGINELHAEYPLQSWKKCQKNSDCEVVVSICGGVETLNKLHAEEYYTYRKKTLDLIRCHSFNENDWQNNIETKCKSNGCKLSVREKKLMDISKLTKFQAEEIKSIYSKIVNDMQIGRFKDCFYGSLKLKKLVNVYESSESHFYLCKNKISN